MLRFIEVVVPGPWWNTLTYTLDSPDVPNTGIRVRVPVGRGERVGFLAGCGESPPERGRANLKAVSELLDERCVLGDELWGLAGWTGRTFLCGMGEALQLICPRPILQGESFPCPSPGGSSAVENRIFRETSCYNPVDEGRNALYVERLLNGGRALVLFPEAESAAFFFARLPAQVKAEALLWPSTGGKKLRASWEMACREEVRVIVGTGGAVFAPMNFNAIIVDDESNPAWVFMRPPRISARSLAGRRALFMKAELVLGGRVPSARTYVRSRPECRTLPQRRNLIFVDMGRSFKNETRGIEGTLPLTKSLVERTRSTLKEGRHALWIMDRRGQAGEVFCSECGKSFLCPRCASLMRSEAGGTTLRCVQCGTRERLPDKCPACRGVLLMGKRPGLDALYPVAARYMREYPVLMDEPRLKRLELPSLLLGTRRLLALCDSVDAGLIAWLDLDAEARKTDYNARFQTFSMVWESFWRGLGGGAERIVLMQTRRSGSAWQSTLWSGWGNFWQGELEERKNLDLPPYGLLVQIDLPPAEDRGTFVRTLEEAGLSVLDAGDASPLRVAVSSIERLRTILAPRFEIRHSRRGFPVATVYAE